MLRPRSAIPLVIAGDGLPYMFPDAIATDFVWLGSHGLMATDFDSLMGHWAAAGPNYYATAKMHWAPEQTNAKQVLAQWCAAFTGATKEISTYIDFWSAFTNASTTCSTLGYMRDLSFVYITRVAVVAIVYWPSNPCHEIIYIYIYIYIPQATFTSNVTRTRIENLTHAISKQASTSHGWYMNVAYVYLADVFNTGDHLLSEARTACTATLSPYTPNAVTYHAQSHYCRFMIGHRH